MLAARREHGRRGEGDEKSWWWGTTSRGVGESGLRAWSTYAFPGSGRRSASSISMLGMSSWIA